MNELRHNGLISHFRALIFDVDGTLAETEEIHRRAFNETFAYFHLPWEWDIGLYCELLKVTGGKERIRHYADDTLHKAVDLTDSEIAKMHRFKTERYAQLIAASGCPLRPGVENLIRTAHERGQRLAIATTTSRGNVEALLVSTLGPDAMKLFDVVVAGDEVSRKKPAPDVYLKAVELLAVSASECLAFEDSQNGFLSAWEAGISVIVTPSLYTSERSFADALAVLNDLESLSDIEVNQKQL